MNFKATFTGSENTTGAAFEGGPFKPGADGVTFYPSVSDDGTLSWTNEAGVPNPEPLNIKGPQGPQGPATEVTKDSITAALGFMPPDPFTMMALSAMHVKLPQDEETNPLHGTAGQFAVSDGKGGITWVTLTDGNGVAY